MFHQASSVFGDLLVLVIDESAPFDAPVLERALLLDDADGFRLSRASLPVEEIAWTGLLRQQSVESYRAWLLAADTVVGAWRAIESDLALARRAVSALRSFERDPALASLLSSSQTARLTALISDAEALVDEAEERSTAVAAAASEAIARAERADDLLVEGAR